MTSPKLTSSKLISPRQKYTQDLDSELIVFDAMQEQVVLRLQFLFDELVANAQRSKTKKPGLSGFLTGWMLVSYTHRTLPTKRIVENT